MNVIQLRYPALRAAWALVLSFTIGGCTSNLIVRNATTTWTDTAKVASAEVANVGNRDAGEFVVYFDADESPVSQNRRPQVAHRVAGLAAGASVLLTADFAPLAHPDNAFLGNVFRIKVIADAKGQVRESQETDNEVTVQISPADCTPASSDVTSGTTGAMQDGQSFNETRAVRATLLGPSSRIVQKLVLKGLNVGGTATTAQVGARIYDDVTHALIGTADVGVAAGMNQTVQIPVTVTLDAGKTYRIGCYVVTSPLWRGSGNYLIPSGFASLTSPTPYTESTGVFLIHSAHSNGSDAFPENPNLAVIQMTIVTACP